MSRWSLFFVLLILLPASRSAAPHSEEPPQKGKGKFTPTGVYKHQITPHWFADNTKFWYRNDLPSSKREFVLVDALKGTRTAAFDHKKLAESLAKLTRTKVTAERLPFTSIEFSKDGKSLTFRIESTRYKCDLDSYECTTTVSVGVLQPQEEVTPTAEENDLFPDGWAPSLGSMPAPAIMKQRRRVPSPDKKWQAYVSENNVYVRDAADNEIQLSKDGKANLAYGQLNWSPDSKTLVALRSQPGDSLEVHLIESSPKGGGRAKLHTRRYPLPGDKFTSHEVNLFDVAAKKHIKPEIDKTDFGTPEIRWNSDGSSFTYQKLDRGHQRFRLIEITATGKVTTVIDEKSKTFIWSAHSLRTAPRRVTWLTKTPEIIYASEKDGWRHLYLLDAKTGKEKHQITKGEYVVRGIDRIDEAERQIWFRASGKNSDQDPYLMHHYRVNFDGTNLVALTEGNGWHSVSYSPDGKFLIDTYSRADLPPVHELRRVSDGKLVCELEKADVSELKAKGWAAPEVFSAMGRDGKTSIWGLIHRPAKLDPKKKYPVIEYIYAGPHDSHVPKTFSSARRFSTLTDLGFIVVQIDGMGTANRSKAFHDVCWQNLKDAGFPDRVLWHKAVAQKYPYYDTSRVGIYGTSAGGQNAMGALLFHGDFYKAAVAACGCHDNRMDKASWNEQWMGYPVGKHYADCSNVDNAYRLKGKLLLIVGEMDTNVPPESTHRVAKALIDARKDFEYLLMPGWDHSDGGTYGQRRLRDFFVRHLQGVEPPDRNAER